MNRGSKAVRIASKATIALSLLLVLFTHCTGRQFERNLSILGDKLGR